MSAENESLIQIRNLKKYFPIHKGAIVRRHVGDVKAVDGVSFDIFRGETLGLVGETGSGKTTIGRTIIRLYEPTEGEVVLDGRNIFSLNAKELSLVRRRIAMIFQDPYSSLNPRMTIGSIIAEPLDIHKIAQGEDKQDRVRELLQMVGLNPYFVNRFPYEFSGGQQQRVGIARALAIHPDLIICDEPISSLDVSIQAQVVTLLENLQEQLGLTYLFIAHDLSMVRHISDRMAVMYLGKIVELAGRDEIYLKPAHPYTQALMSAVPVPDPDVAAVRQRIILEGDIPSPANPPIGCNFNTRCPIATDICFELEPEFLEIKPEHWAACHFADQFL